jgi:hypothetical protein
MSIFEMCALAIAVSFTSVFVVCSTAIVLGIIMVIFGREHD